MPDLNPEDIVSIEQDGFTIIAKITCPDCGRVERHRADRLSGDTAVCPGCGFSAKLDGLGALQAQFGDIPNMAKKIFNKR